MRITLYNDYHNTFVSLNVNGQKLSLYQVKKAWKELCGIKNCGCSGDVGYRGPQEDGVQGIEPIRNSLTGEIEGAWIHLHERE